MLFWRWKIKQYNGSTSQKQNDNVLAFDFFFIEYDTAQQRHQNHTDVQRGKKDRTVKTTREDGVQKVAASEKESDTRRHGNRPLGEGRTLFVFGDK